MNSGDAEFRARLCRENKAAQQAGAAGVGRGERGRAPERGAENLNDAERERLGLPGLARRLRLASSADRITAKRRRVNMARQDLRYMQLIGALDDVKELVQSPEYQAEKRRQRVAAALAALERAERR